MNQASSGIVAADRKDGKVLGSPTGRALTGKRLAPHHRLTGTALLLTAIGGLMVTSASTITSLNATGSPFSIAVKQGMWTVVGLVLFGLGTRVPQTWMRRLAYPLLVGCALALIAVLVPGIGASAYGARRWIALPGLQFQPSEPAKLALVLWGADLLTRKRRLLSDPKHLLIPLLPVGLVLALLILLEPDMGTMMVLTAVLFGLFITVGASRRLLLVMSGAGAVAVAAVAVAAPYRLARLTSFVDPFADASGTGYQAVQGLYALSNGGWFGVGLGASRQKWGALPNAYTDYIFAILGEELGLAGTLSVLLLFVVFATAGTRIAIAADNMFDRLAAAGITVWVLSQAILNMGAVTSTLPITGIPLPLLSYGGSSLAVTLFAIGLLISIGRQTTSRTTLRRPSPSSRHPGAKSS